MADVKWIKITTNMFDNRKIKHLRRLPEGDSIVLIWVMLLTMAGRCNANGMIFLTENIPYTPKMLADELDFEENTVKLALEALENFEMIVTDGRFFSIAGWEEYQNIEGMDKIREQNRLRQKKWYDSKKALDDPNVRSNVRLTQPNATEEDIDKEIEEDKEKEFHSINHSLAHEENIYIQEMVKAKGFEGEDAEAYAEELRQGLKQKYMGGLLGQGVIMISDEQFGDLCERLSLDELDKYFNIVAECEKNGKRYKRKSHYQAILDMALKDRKVLQKSGKG